MMNEEMKRLNPLIDADILVYRCGFAADSQAKRDLGEAAAETDYTGWALANVKAVIETVLNDVFTLHTWKAIYLSGSDNFREQVATILPYKGNRDATHKPKYYREIKDYLIDRWDAQVIDGMEADDAIGIEQFRNKDKSTVIVSIDKDLNTIPGYHYNWVKQDFYYVNMTQANNFFFLQMLEGDRTDNIPGIDGIGPKTCLKILAEVGEDTVKLRERVIQLYKNQYGNQWLESYNEVAKLLWILRESDKGCPFLLAED